MHIIEGPTIEGTAWRVLVLLEPGQSLDIGWNFGHQLARSNGQLVSAVLVPTRDEQLLSQGRETLARAAHVCLEQVTHYTLLIEAPDFRQSVTQLVEDAGIDLVIASADMEGPFLLERLPCAVAVMRGQAYGGEVVVEDAADGVPTPAPIDRILLPTVGGPNTVDALQFLLPLTSKGQTEITALLVTTDYLSVDAETVGAARLRQALQFADAVDRVEAKTVVSWSAAAGIVEEANNDYDLVIIGASRESSIERALFGNIVDSVVRQSKKPVIVVRQANDTLGTLGARVAWQVQRVFKRKNMAERVQIYTRLRRSARADTDYFTLTALSAGIAAFGLLLSSPAVIIGAMLVAPLMSPIVGTGLAIVQGEGRFLRLALATVLRGALWGIVVGFIIGMLRPNTPLTEEVLLRTAPTLLDLGVALLAGMAGAYALCESDAAGALPGVAIAAALVPPLASAGIAFASFLFGVSELQLALGAVLLFSTNFIAITSAAVLVFLALGFRPSVSRKERRHLQVRTVRIALAMLLIISVLLGAITFSLAQENALKASIRDVTVSRLQDIDGVELQDLDVSSLDGHVVNLELTVRSTRTTPLGYDAVVQLQEAISADLQREIALELVVIPVTRLDAITPPTLTPTPTASATITPGPTPTVTITPSVTPTATASPSPTASATASPTETPAPSATPTAAPTETLTPAPSPTPDSRIVNSPYGLNMRSEPEATSELVAFLPEGTTVVRLEGRIEIDDAVWQEILYDGLTGWVLAEYLDTPTAP